MREFRSKTNFCCFFLKIANESFRRNLLASSFLEPWFLPFPSSLRLSQASCLCLGSLHRPVFIRVLIMSAPCQSLPGSHCPSRPESSCQPTGCWVGITHTSTTVFPTQLLGVGKASCVNPNNRRLIENSKLWIPGPGILVHDHV